MDGWLRSTDAAQYSPINRKSIRAPVNFRNSQNRFRRVSGSAFSPQHRITCRACCDSRYRRPPRFIVTVETSCEEDKSVANAKCIIVLECRERFATSRAPTPPRTSSHLARNNRIHFRSKLFRKSLGRALNVVDCRYSRFNINLCEIIVSPP